MECKVTIFGADGEFTSRGELNTFDGGFTLSYGIDGDNCLLQCINGVVTQTRSGSLCLEMCFEEGKESLCTLGESEMRGSFPVHCNKISYTVSKNGVALKLNYECGGEKMKLELAAEYV